jgi:hypothetical protein
MLKLQGSGTRGSAMAHPILGICLTKASKAFLRFLCILRETRSALLINPHVVIVRAAKPLVAAEADALVAIQLDCFVAALLAMTGLGQFICSGGFF